MIVVDASLAAKWVLWEDDSHEALQFLAQYGREFCGPDLVFTEVAGAIVKRANSKKNIEPDALRALDKWTIAWDDHIIRPHRVTQSRLFRAARLAIKLGHPLADCIYLALAMEFRCDLATCDAKFQKKAVQLHPGVRLLSSYGKVTAADN